MPKSIRSAIDAVRGQPLWFRLLLRLALVSLIGLGPAIRVCYWLTVGAITEAWPWLLWGEPYLEFAARMLQTGRPVVWICLLVLSWWLLGFLLEPKPDKDRKLGTKLALLAPKLVGWTAVAACLAVVLPLLAVSGVRAVRTWPPRTDHVLQDNCGHCHSPYRPQHYIKSPQMWERTVRRMVERNGAPVEREDADRAIAWLSDYRGFDDAWMFRAKCNRCHGRQHILAEPRTAQEWAWAVERVGWLNPFAFRADQKDQIVRYLTREHAIEPPAEGTPERAELDARLELQRACNPCHSISLIRQEGAMDDPRGMVERMSRKNPDLVPPHRIDAITATLEGLPSDEAAFWRLFPHDVLLDLEPR